MTGALQIIRHFVTAEDGATMPEYALMVAFIALVCIAAVTLIGTNASGIFNNVATGIGAA